MAIPLKFLQAENWILERFNDHEVARLILPYPGLSNGQSHNGMEVEGVERIDFMNQFIKDHPEYEVKFFRKDDLGYWEVRRRNYVQIQ